MWNKKITLDVKNEEIGAVVGKMFAGQNVVSSVEGKMIAIMSAPREAGRRGPRFGQCRREGAS